MQVAVPQIAIEILVLPPGTPWLQAAHQVATRGVGRGIGQNQPREFVQVLHIVTFEGDLQVHAVQRRGV